MTVFPQNIKAYESLSATDTALGLTQSVYMNVAGDYPVVGAIITVEGNSIRVKLDGSDPSTTDGHLFDIGSVLRIEGLPNLSNFKFISSDGTTTATIRVSYYGRF